MLDPDALKATVFPDLKHTYTARDTMLYALGIGLGSDPLDARQLRFVYEQNLLAMPTMAVVLGYPGFWMQRPETGIDWVKVVHGEERLRIHQPIPPSGTVIGRMRVTAVIDKGRDKGTLVVTGREVSDQASGKLLATVEHVTFCRGDGGSGGADEAPAALPAVPPTPPAFTCELTTLPQAALIYRLSSDYNPLHAAPEVAAKAGFARPILHGLGTYGVAAHAILRTLCDYDPARLTRFDCRFSAPFYPGERLLTEIWRGEGAARNTLQFQSRSVERGVIVLGNGIAEISQEAP
jgi:acyl dehydratase